MLNSYIVSLILLNLLVIALSIQMCELSKKSELMKRHSFIATVKATFGTNWPMFRGAV